MVNSTEPSSAMETTTAPLTANVARILILLRSLGRGRHNLDDPWIVLPLQLHEYDDLIVRIGKNETLWGWFYDKAKFVYGSGDAAVSYHMLTIIRISYDSRTSTFVIRRPVNVHEAFKSRVSSWIQDRLRAIADSDAQLELFVEDIVACGSATVRLESPDNERMVISHDPDSQFKYLGTCWPSVVIELAKSRGPKCLSRLARDYILQSQGYIRAVVGFELDTQTEKVSLTVWRSHLFIHPERGPTVGMRSETQVLRDELGIPNPVEGSGLRLMLHDFAPDFIPDDLTATADPDVSLLIGSAALCEFLGKIEESERKREAGELFKSPRFTNLVKRFRTPEPVEVYEEDGFVFGEEELSIHERFLDRRVRTGMLGEGSEMAERG